MKTLIKDQPLVIVRNAALGPCHEWTGVVDRDGYGRRQFRGRPVGAHRAAWIEAFGDPGLLMVLHYCDNPPCYRLDHLHLGNNSQNQKEAYTRGRHSQVGERNVYSQLTDILVSEIREIYATGEYTQREVAKMFNISQSVICNVVNRRAWSHIK